MSYLFKKALVRKPSKSIVNGISSSGEEPSFEQVKIEHKNYINILIDSKVELFTLNPLENYPDSVFVEDPAICLLYTSPSPRDGLLSRMPSSA